MTESQRRKLQWIGDVLFVLFRPRHWIRNHRTNFELDKYIRDGLKNGDIKPVGYYECIINDKVVWVQNYPYSYGTVNGMRGMPRASTVVKLRKKLKQMGIQ